jgi:hypothetical protein
VDALVSHLLAAVRQLADCFLSVMLCRSRKRQSELRLVRIRRLRMWGQRSRWKACPIPRRFSTASLLWGGGFTIFRDVVQLVSMLILIRLLAQVDYGRVALARTIVDLLAVVSFGTFATHTLQAREPAEIDWQAHFTAGVVINSVLAFFTLQ